jgi:prepilin-type N-terminal cleavage/methylation domain-containing protein
MNRLVRGIRISGSQAGFTMVEFLAAVFVISLGLWAAGAGFATAIQGFETSRLETAATFLAEQRLEQVRATALGYSPIGCMGFANITTACFPAQGYATSATSVTNAPSYRSTVTITDYMVNGNITRKRVDVEVFYRPIVAPGALATERSVRLSTFITNHT